MSAGFKVYIKRDYIPELKSDKLTNTPGEYTIGISYQSRFRDIEGTFCLIIVHVLIAFWRMRDKLY